MATWKDVHWADVCHHVRGIGQIVDHEREGSVSIRDGHEVIRDELNDFFGENPQEGTMADVLRHHVLSEHGSFPDRLHSTDPVVVRCAELQLDAFARRMMRYLE